MLDALFVQSQRNFACLSQFPRHDPQVQISQFRDRARPAQDMTRGLVDLQTETACPLPTKLTSE